MKSFVVFGCGRFGSTVATTLVNLHNEVLAIDINEEKVQRIAEQVTTAIQVDVMDSGVLEDLGLKNFDVAVIAIGSNLESAIMSTIACTEAGIPLIIAKAPSRRHGAILKKIGAHQIIYPEKDMGERIAHNLSANGIMDYIELSEEYSIVEFNIAPAWHGKTLAELDLRNRYSINIIAIRRGHDLLVEGLATESLMMGDILIFFGSRKQIEKIEGLHSV